MVALTGNDVAPMASDMPELGETKRDAVVAYVRGAACMVPFAGSILAEVVNSVIPQQRMERLEDYVRRLKERLSVLNEEILSQRMRKPENVDLFEDGAIQAARALSGVPTLGCQDPVMDGFEKFCRPRAMPRIARVPIAFLTAERTKEAIMAGQSAGG